MSEQQTAEQRALALRWLSYLATERPQLRLMQIVFNALDGTGLARHEDGTPRDVFYVRDEQLYEALRKAAEGK